MGVRSSYSLSSNRHITCTLISKFSVFFPAQNVLYPGVNLQSVVTLANLNKTYDIVEFNQTLQVRLYIHSATTLWD